MKTSHLQITDVAIRQLLMIPEGWNIHEVKFDSATAILRIDVHAENLPGEDGGEICGQFLQHDDGVCATWRPVKPPGPMTFMRETGTDRCFWCKREFDEHEMDEMICPIQPEQSPK